MTYKELLTDGIAILTKSDIQSASTNAELLLCHYANLSKIELSFKKNEIINDISIIENYKKGIIERSTNKPLQYIIGQITFYNISLYINENVLIPRPETEELVELVIKNSTALLKTKTPEINIIDLCSGSGCVSLALAKHYEKHKNINIVGIDISKDAVDVALFNKKNLSLKNINYINIDFFDFIKHQQSNTNSTKYDIIVCNPPYISESDYHQLDKELFFEPRIALTDEHNGLTFFQAIADNIDYLLSPKGTIFFECGLYQAEKIKRLFEEKHHSAIIHKDFAGIDRFLQIK